MICDARPGTSLSCWPGCGPRPGRRMPRSRCFGRSWRPSRSCATGWSCAWPSWNVGWAWTARTPGCRRQRRASARRSAVRRGRDKRDSSDVSGAGDCSRNGEQELPRCLPTAASVTSAIGSAGRQEVAFGLAYSLSDPHLRQGPGRARCRHLAAKERGQKAPLTGGTSTGIPAGLGAGCPQRGAVTAVWPRVPVRPTSSCGQVGDPHDRQPPVGVCRPDRRRRPAGAAAARELGDRRQVVLGWRQRVRFPDPGDRRIRTADHPPGRPLLTYGGEANARRASRRGRRARRGHHQGHGQPRGHDGRHRYAGAPGGLGFGNDANTCPSCTRATRCGDGRSRVEARYQGGLDRGLRGLPHRERRHAA